MFLELPDAFLEVPDAFLELPDAFLEPPDAFLEVPDAFLELPDTFLELPDAILELPDAFLELPDSFNLNLFHINKKSTFDFSKVLFVLYNHLLFLDNLFYKLLSVNYNSYKICSCW